MIGAKKIAAAGAVVAATAGVAIATSSSPTSNPPINTIPLLHCQARDGGQLPDPTCTPGATDPRVTQANISKTICVPGYTATVRPSTTVTNRLKRLQMAAYGYASRLPSGFEEDHLISLELGGSPASPKNLWPEFPHSPNPKDKIENLLHKRICAGTISLRLAQQEISHDWTVVR